jgi:hypothetical protein
MDNGLGRWPRGCIRKQGDGRKWKGETFKRRKTNEIYKSKEQRGWERKRENCDLVVMKRKYVFDKIYYSEFGSFSCF